MLVWKSLLGFGWKTLSLPIVDWMAAVSIVALIILFINRLINPVLKMLSGPAEWANLLFVFLPMVTGYIMTHHLWFRYEVLFSLHMIAVDMLFHLDTRQPHFTFCILFFSQKHSMAWISAKRSVEP